VVPRLRLLASFLLPGLLGCSGPSEPPTPDVLLIVIDTLRADRLTPYADPGRATSPHLQALVEAGEFEVLEGLVASSSWTKPSMATIWTGLDPVDHDVMRLQGDHARLGEQPTLPELMRDGGYRTGCVMSNFLLTRRMGAGFDRGFDYWDDAPGRHPDPHRGSTAADVAASGIAWLEESATPGPRFLMLHFFDPHASFEDHPEVDFAPADYEGWVVPGASTDLLRERAKGTSEADHQALLGWYDEEVWAVDRAIGRVVDTLKAQGRWDSTMVMITADHGEELGERGHIGHTQTLWTELVEVPLLVRVPPAYRDRWSLPAAPAGGYAMKQLMPALLGVAGQEAPAGVSVAAPAVLVSQVDFEPVRKEHLEKYVQKTAIRAEGYQLTHDRIQDQRTLHDLRADPGTTTPLPADHPAWERMRELEAAQSFWEGR
jgi:arylsulfatase A-like enzyme